MPEPKKKAKKRKKRSAAEKKKAKHEKHVKDYEGEIVQKFKAWHDGLVERRIVAQSLESTWIRKSGYVIKLWTQDHEFHPNKRALEAGIEARSKYHMSEPGGERLRIDLTWLLKDSWRTGLIEKGLEILRSKREKERVERPGVMRVERERSVQAQLPASWRHDQVVRNRETGRYGVVKRQNGTDGIRWTWPHSEFPDLFCLTQAQGITEAELEQIEIVVGEDKSNTIQTWKTLKREGRLLAPRELVEAAARRRQR